MNGDLQEALYSLCLHGIRYTFNQSTSMEFRVRTRFGVMGHGLGVMGCGLG